MSDDVLLSIALDTGTLYFSFNNTSTDSQYYEGRILGMDGIKRMIRPGGGVSAIQTTSFNLGDPSGELKTLSDITTFKRRAVTVKYADDDGGLTTVFNGLVERVSSTPESFGIEARDDSWDVLTEAIPLRVFPDIFSDMPITTPVELIPIVIGTVSSASFDARGAIPAYLVDPAETLAVWRYVAAQHGLKSITKVYNFGIEVDAGDWTTSYANMSTDFGTVRMTFIDFDYEMRDEWGNAEITYDATGITVTPADETGALETDIPDGLKLMLSALQQTSPLVAGDFASTTAVNTQYSDESISLSNNGIAITEWGTTWLDVIDMFAESFNLQVFINADGDYQMRFDDAQAGTSTKTFVDSQNIVQGSFSVATPDESLATYETSYAKDYARGKYINRKSYNDSTEETALGREATGQLELDGIRSINDAQKIAQIKLFQQRSSRQVVSCTVPVQSDLELGDFVSLTHYAGPSTDGAGFDAALFCVYETSLLSADGGFFHELLLIDHPGLSIGSPADSEPTRTEQDIPDYITSINADAVWEASDDDTVVWSSHTLKVARQGGRVDSYSITGANTGNMTGGSKYYIYLDAATSDTTYQTSTTYSDSVGLGKILVCECGAGTTVAWIKNKVGWVESGLGGGGSDVPSQVTYEEVETPDLERLVNLTGDLVVADGKSITLNAGGDLIMTPHVSNMSEVIFTGVGYLRATLATVSLYGTTGSAAKSVGVASYEDASNFSLLSLQDSSGFQALLTAEDGGNTSELAVVGGASGYASLEVQDTVEFEVRSGYIRSNGYLEIYDGVTAPGTPTSHAAIYVDTADGDLKVKFSDGHVATIATDS